MHPTITEPANAAATAGNASRNPRYVFVYGTLRHGQERDINRLTPAPVFICTSQMPGTLYHLGVCNYPGLRLGGATWVQGDVYGITPELERKLDEIEQVWPHQSGEYAKQEVVVQCAVGALTCLVYEVAADRIASSQVIAGGDWVTRERRITEF